MSPSFFFFRIDFYGRDDRYSFRLRSCRCEYFTIEYCVMPEIRLRVYKKHFIRFFSRAGLKKKPTKYSDSVFPMTYACRSISRNRTYHFGFMIAVNRSIEFLRAIAIPMFYIIRDDAVEKVGRKTREQCRRRELWLQENIKRETFFRKIRNGRV